MREWRLHYKIWAYGGFVVQDCDFRLHSARCKTLGCMVQDTEREAIKSKMRDCRLQSAGYGTGGYIKQDAGKWAV
jgi:hypothetical protein